MLGEETFTKWAGEHEWGDWVKPTLFAQNFPGMIRGELIESQMNALMEKAKAFLNERQAGSISAVEADGTRSFAIVDVEGALSVALGILLLEKGFAPIPLFNGVQPQSAWLIDNTETVNALSFFAGKISKDFEGPPAFLLDSRRARGSASPKQYDNRWIVFPQDFPSGERLRFSGFSKCHLFFDPLKVSDDLAHVLVRFQNAGIQMIEWGKMGPAKIEIEKPLWFKSVFYRASALMGFSPNSMGGFGALIPEPSRGGYYG